MKAKPKTKPKTKPKLSPSIAQQMASQLGIPVTITSSAGIPLTAVPKPKHLPKRKKKAK
jgi:hypothetical protein